MLLGDNGFLGLSPSLDEDPLSQDTIKNEAMDTKIAKTYFFIAFLLWLISTLKDKIFRQTISIIVFFIS